MTPHKKLKLANLCWQTLVGVCERDINVCKDVDRLVRNGTRIYARQRFIKQTRISRANVCQTQVVHFQRNPHTHLHIWRPDLKMTLRFREVCRVKKRVCQPFEHCKHEFINLSLPNEGGLKGTDQIRTRTPRLSSSPLSMMWLKTNSGVSSLNGGTPVRNSYKQTPSDHQSTAGAEGKREFRIDIPNSSKTFSLPQVSQLLGWLERHTGFHKIMGSRLRSFLCPTLNTKSF